MIRPPSTRYVSSGNWAISTDGDILRATVGPGLALLVTCETYQIGGLLHLTNMTPSQISSNSNDIALMIERILTFISAIPTQNHQSNCRMQIVGASSLANFLPRHARKKSIQTQVSIIQNTVSASGITIEKITTGGDYARTIIMDFRKRSTSIVPVARAAVLHKKRRSSSRLPADTTQAKQLIRVDTGQLVVQSSPHSLISILGSCIGVAIYDRLGNVGGMAHVMIPEAPPQTAEPGKFADTAIPALCQALINKGAIQSRLEAKIAGGANVLTSEKLNPIMDIGGRNTQNVISSLKEHSIPLREAETGGFRGRKMIFCLDSFNMESKFVGPKEVF